MPTDAGDVKVLRARGRARRGDRPAVPALDVENAEIGPRLGFHGQSWVRGAEQSPLRSIYARLQCHFFLEDLGAFEFHWKAICKDFLKHGIAGCELCPCS
jgi:hypothetical protein